MAEPKMSDLCAVCGERYGVHQLIGNSCPKTGEKWSYLPTRFKLKKKNAVRRASTTSDQ